MRILIADRQPRVRFALRILLQRRSDIQVAAEAGNIEDLLDGLQACCPDVVLLGWELPGGDGSALIPVLRSRCPNLRIVALSGRLEGRHEALAAGVDAFVSKSDPPERLLAAIAHFASQTCLP